MKTYSYTFLSLIIAAGLGLAPSTNALDIGDGTNYVGYVSPSNVNPEKEAALIDELTTVEKDKIRIDTSPNGKTTTVYNREDGIAGPFPTASGTAYDKYELPDNSTQTTFDVSGYQYVIGKYNGSDGGMLVWYKADGFGDAEELPGTFNGKALSHVTFFSNVPDGGTTMALFGVALLGVGGVRRIASRRG